MQIHHVEWTVLKVPRRSHLCHIYILLVFSLDLQSGYIMNYLECVPIVLVFCKLTLFPGEIALLWHYAKQSQ